MSNIRSIDMMLLDDVFEMGSGYVLNFSDRTFARFFAEELNSDEEIQIWNESARLVANVIIYFNSKVLSNLLDSFEDQGNTRSLETVKRASPVTWENINLRGIYTFAPTGELPKLEDLMASIEGYRTSNDK